MTWSKPVAVGEGGRGHGRDRRWEPPRHGYVAPYGQREAYPGWGPTPPRYGRQPPRPGSGALIDPGS